MLGMHSARHGYTTARGYEIWSIYDLVALRSRKEALEGSAQSAGSGSGTCRALFLSDPDPDQRACLEMLSV